MVAQALIVAVLAEALAVAVPAIALAAAVVQAKVWKLFRKHFFPFGHPLPRGKHVQKHLPKEKNNDQTVWMISIQYFTRILASQSYFVLIEK